MLLIKRQDLVHISMNLKVIYNLLRWALQMAFTITAFSSVTADESQNRTISCAFTKMSLLVHEYSVSLSSRFSTSAQQVITFISSASDKFCVEVFSLQKQLNCNLKVYLKIYGFGTYSTICRHDLWFTF